MLKALKTVSGPDPFPRSDLVRLARHTLARAPVFGLVHDLWHTIGQRVAGDPQVRMVSVSALRAGAADWEQRWHEATKCLTAQAVELLQSRETVATISNSGAVGDVLEQLAARGRRITVWCAESLPGGEGHDFCARVSRHGHRAEVVADEEMPSRVASAGLLLTGADAVDLHSFINKIGTGILTEAARTTVVLAESAKWTPPDWGVGSAVPDFPPMDFETTHSGEPLPMFERVFAQPGLRIMSESGGATTAEIEAGLARKPVWHPLCS